MKRKVKNITKRLGYLFLVLMILMGSMPNTTVYAAESAAYSDHEESDAGSKNSDDNDGENDDGNNSSDSDKEEGSNSNDKNTSDSDEEESGSNDENTSDSDEEEPGSDDVIASDSDEEEPGSDDENVSGPDEEDTTEPDDEDMTETFTEELTEPDMGAVMMFSLTDVSDEYIVGDEEEFSVDIVDDSLTTCFQDNQYYRQADVEVSLEGFHDIDENDDKSLIAEIEVTPAAHVISATEQLEFDKNSRNKTFQLVVDKADEYTVKITFSGVREDDGDYTATGDISNSFTIEMTSQDVVMKDSPDKITLKYGEKLDIEEFAGNALEKEGEYYPGTVKWSVVNGNSCFERNGNDIRAIGVPEGTDTPVIKVWYDASSISNPSEPVEIPLEVLQASPAIMISAPFSEDASGNRIAYINERYDWLVKVKPLSDEPEYADLLNHDGWKVKYTVEDISTHTVKRVERTLTLSNENDCICRNENITVNNSLFAHMRSGRQYKFTVDLIIDEEAQNAYNIPDSELHKSYDCILRPATAHVQVSDNRLDNMSYRNDKDKVINLGVCLKHDTLFGGQTNISNAELEGVTYTICSQDPNVAWVDTDAVYYANQVSSLLVKIVGVGETIVTINTRGSQLYNISGASVTVKVSNSTLRSEDYKITYKVNGSEKSYTATEWQRYLEEHDNWLNDTFNVSLTDTGRAYYDTLYYSIGNGNAHSGTDGSITLGEEAGQEDLEYTLWMQNSETHASTQGLGNCTMTIKKDTEKPEGEGISDNRDEKAFEVNDNGVTTWRFGKEFILEGTFKDEVSGLETIQWTKDGGRSWNTVNGCQNTISGDGKSFSIELSDGEYAGVAVRAIDKAGNVSEEYRITDGDDRYVAISIDTTIPVCEITVRTDSKVLEDAELASWTNESLNYTYRNVGNVYKVYYQFVPVGKVLEAEKNGTKPYTSNGWVEMPGEGFTVGSTDHPVNRNGVYYFKAKSTHGVFSEVQEKIIMLQQNMQEKMPLMIENDRQEEWYNAQTGTPQITFSYRDYLSACVTGNQQYAAPITIHRVLTVEGVSESIIDYLGSEQTAMIGFGSWEEYGAYLDGAQGYEEQDYQEKVQALDISFIKDDVIYDGIYTLRYWIEDAAGNKSEESTYEFKIDTHKPTDIEAYLDGEKMQQSDGGTINYYIFKSSTVSGNATAEDALSGIESIKVLKTKSVMNWTDSSELDGGDEFSISPCTRCFLYVIAEDKAGNTDYIITDGVVVDDQKPVGKDAGELILEPQGANSNGFFNDDVTIKIAIKDAPDSDNYSSLRDVKCAIGKEESTKEERSLYHASRQTLTEGELKQQKEYETEVVIDAEKYESNYAFLDVTAEDYSANISTSTQAIKIDVTQPEVSVTFDNNNVKNHSYYNADRKATIHVKELNFDSKGVDIQVTKDGADYEIAPLTWSTEEGEHYATILFSADGDYTLSVKCTDLADNESEKVTVEPFTIDKTRPEVEVTYDKETAHKDNYYNTPRTATITVTEHNFNQNDFILETVPRVALGSWTHNGDIHQAKLNFTEDGYYTFSCEYTDLAGNSMDRMEPQEFYIDTVAPVVTITGVMDGSANAGEVTPVITITEENYNNEETDVFVKTGLGEDVSVSKAVHAVENGYTYTLTDMTDKEDNVYYLTVQATDFAGNNTETIYRFSLNRHGSTYDLSDMLAVSEKIYYQSVDMQDISIVEMNVDKIEKFSVYLSRNGNMLQAEQVESMPSANKDKVYYRVDMEGDERTGYRYRYTIFRENFEQEGSYNISFYSKDKAGNEVNSTLDEKDAELRFVIDNTAPRVIIDGVEAGEVYTVAAKDVNVMVTDNFLLTDAEFYLVNQTGEELGRWNYLDMVEEQGDTMQIIIPEYDGEQSLLYRVVDAAGNEIVTLADSEATPTGFFVTTNPLAQFVSTPGKSETRRIIKLLLALSAMAASIGALCYLKKRKAKE